jgi:hypothetical protein
MKSFLWASYATLILICHAGKVNGQSQEKVYAALLIKLSRGIQWPAENQSRNFVIGVIAYSPLAEELKSSVLTIKKGKQPIVIKELSGPDDCGNCDVLFIPSFKSKILPAILNKIGNSSTLIVTNKPDMTKAGSGINFLFDSGKIKYEINAQSIERRGMKISSDIKNMGILIL